MAELRAVSRCDDYQACTELFLTADRDSPVSELDEANATAFELTQAEYRQMAWR